MLSNRWLSFFIHILAGSFFIQNAYPYCFLHDKSYRKQQQQWHRRHRIALSFSSSSSLTVDLPTSTTSLTASEAAVVPSSSSLDDEEESIIMITTTAELNQKIQHLCQQRAWSEAIELIRTAEDSMVCNHYPNLTTTTTNTTITPFPFPNEESYRILFSTWAQTLTNSNNTSQTKVVIPTPALEMMDRVFTRMQQLSQSFPSAIMTTRHIYHALLLAWSHSYTRTGAMRAEELLSELYDLYQNSTNNNNNNNNNNNEEDDRFRPTLSCYVSTLNAMARAGGGKKWAIRAEALLEQMERLSTQTQLERLKPTTICVNIVINAWCKSGAREAGERCSRLLQKLQNAYSRRCTNLRPNLVSFNTVLDALANSPGNERRAEELLEYMHQISSTNSTATENNGHHINPMASCSPDLVSFNSVMNAWARSPRPDAAQRADDILQHMEKRYESNTSTIAPDCVAYNTVMASWARSKDGEKAAHNTERVFRRMEKAYRRGNARAKPTGISYNILMNAMVRSKEPMALNRAFEIFETMKRLDRDNPDGRYRPDAVTYTTIINVLAKQGENKEASEKAIDLLVELEGSYNRTMDRSLKPNIRTYTAVIHAIARSRKEPERAEQILHRLEEQYRTTGDRDFQPDTVLYDAVLNAFAWSRIRGKSRKCYEISQTMFDLYNRGRNPLAKPDIITCNSVLNSCVHDVAVSSVDRESIVDIVVKTLERFQSAAPQFGWPDHISYSATIQAIDRHVVDPSMRSKLAESTFWQCAKNGHVSVLVVTSLYKVLPRDRFAEILGDAFVATEEDNVGLHFHWNSLPLDWTRFAPSHKERRSSRPSLKRRSTNPSVFRHSQPEKVGSQFKKR